MSSFHVNAKGEPGRCGAKQGNCPFGGEDAHHDSAEAARAAYEHANGDAAVPPPARAIPKPQGQLPFLDKLDAAYNDLVEAARRGEPGPLRPNEVNREASNMELEDIETAMEEIVADHRDRMGAGPKTPEKAARSAEFRKHWRKTMLDQLENRTGEQLDADVALILPDGRTVLSSDEFGQYEPGEYPATYMRDGEAVEVRVAVYEDGSSRAFLPDYRDDYGHRVSLIEPTRATLENAKDAFPFDLDDSQPVSDAKGKTDTAVRAALYGHSWATPEHAARALDTLYEAEEDLWDRVANDNLSDADREGVEAVAEKLGELQANAYIMAGRVKLGERQEAYEPDGQNYMKWMLSGKTQDNGDGTVTVETVQVGTTAKPVWTVLSQDRFTAINDVPEGKAKLIGSLSGLSQVEPPTA